MEIHWVHADDLSEEEREATEARIRALAEGHADLIDVRITAVSGAHHEHGDKEVRIACQARGRELVASRTRADVGLALNEVLDAFEREVRRLRERRRDRRSERPTAPPLLGIVDRIFREGGYGFVLTDAGEQVYFHANALTRGLTLEGLREGDRVGLDYEPGEKGPQAIFVEPAPPDASSP